MKFVATITVMPQKEILDPQGKAIGMGLTHLGLTTLTDVRVGKNLTLTVEADSEAGANQLVDAACKKLLANLIMEEYSFTLMAV